MTQNAVLYARVSTDEQAKGYSLPTQLEAMRQYAAGRGFGVAAEFQDDYTGESLDRPGLDALRARLTAGDVSAVIVLDVDRLARKSVYQMLIEDELKRLGAIVEYVNGQYANTDEGRLQKQIRGAIAEYEKAKIIERSKRGKRGKAQSGFVVPGARPPYGYQVKAEPHKAWFEVDEHEATIIRLVFTWYLYGEPPAGPMAMGAIAAKLTAMHVPTRGDQQKYVAKKRGFGVWTQAMVRHILTNETYTGVWYYGKTRMMPKDEARKVKKKRQPRKAPADKSKAKIGTGEQVARPRDEWVPVSVPAIVSGAAFAAVKARLRVNRETAQRNRRREYLLSGRLKCAKCGYSYVGRTRREKHRYYLCNGAQQIPVKLCDMPAFRLDDVDNTIWEWIKGVLKHPDKLAAGLRAEKAEAERASATLRTRLALIDARLKETEGHLAELLDLYLSKKFPEHVLDTRKAILDKARADLTRERAELTEHLAGDVLTDDDIATIEAEAAEIREGLDLATFEDKRRYLDLLKVRGRLAIENDERTVYASCRFGQQRLSVTATSPLSNIGATATRPCACPPTAPCP